MHRFYSFLKCALYSTQCAVRSKTTVVPIYLVYTCRPSFLQSYYSPAYPPKPLIISEKNGVRKRVENPMLGGGGNRTRGRQAHKRGEFSSQPSAGKSPAPPDEKTGIYSTT
eukprot:COSAG02_NODE_2775_length_8040_cov_9.109365_7_plen_111_part_00